MKSKNPIRYKTECGCEVENSSIIKIKNTDGPNYSACVKHEGKVIYRIRECMDCGNDYTMTPHGPGGIRCNPCGKIEKTKKRKESAKKYAYTYKRKQKTVWETDFRGDYCSFLEGCKVFGNSNCDNCDEFLPIFSGVDPAKTIGMRVEL